MNKDKTVRVRELLAARDMTTAEIVREVPFKSVASFYSWLEGKSAREFPIYETDDRPRKFGLLKMHSQEAQ